MKSKNKQKPLLNYLEDWFKASSALAMIQCRARGWCGYQRFRSFLWSAWSSPCLWAGQSSEVQLRKSPLHVRMCFIITMGVGSSHHTKIFLVKTLSLTQATVLLFSHRARLAFFFCVVTFRERGQSHMWNLQHGHSSWIPRWSLLCREMILPTLTPVALYLYPVIPASREPFRSPHG